MSDRITSRHLARARFGRAWWGYSAREVDLLVRRMLRAVERLEREEDSFLGPADVDGTEFGMRIGGYRPDQVDELLDRVADRLREVAPLRAPAKE
ncbi:MAG: DivIVA domain-containing protein, partial [Acidimicrobiia bacterium]